MPNHRIVILVVASAGAMSMTDKFGSRCPLGRIPKSEAEASGVDCRNSQWSTSELNRVAEGASNCD